MRKPFIKLLHTINAGYFYDVNRNQIVDVSEEGYQYLQDLLADREVGAEPEEITYLKQAGYLSDHHVEKIEHPQTAIADIMLQRNVEKITLQLTQQCNFRCSYCVYSDDGSSNGNQRTHSNKFMSFATACKAVDFLRDHSIDCEKVDIGFYGGEPLLEFDLIKQVIAYAEQVLLGKEITYTMTTNGSLLTDEVIDYIAEHNFNLMLSFDGPKEIQDKNRILRSGKGSYNLVYHNIQQLQERHPDYAKHIFCNMVINPEDDFDLINSIFTDPVIGKINFTTTLIDDSNSKKKRNFSLLYTIKNEYHMFLESLIAIGRLDQKSSTPILNAFFSDVKRRYNEMQIPASLANMTAPSGPCIPGQNRMLVTVDGDFIPCERVSENAPCNRIGDLEHGFEMERVRQLLNIAQLSAAECQDCYAFIHCSQCVKVAVKDGTLSKEAKLSCCPNVRSTFNLQLRLMLLLRESELYQDEVDLWND